MAIAAERLFQKPIIAFYEVCILREGLQWKSFFVYALSVTKKIVTQSPALPHCSLRKGHAHISLKDNNSIATTFMDGQKFMCLCA